MPARSVWTSLRTSSHELLGRLGWAVIPAPDATAVRVGTRRLVDEVRERGTKRSNADRDRARPEVQQLDGVGLAAHLPGIAFIDKA